MRSSRSPGRRTRRRAAASEPSRQEDLRVLSGCKKFIRSVSSPSKAPDFRRARATSRRPTVSAQALEPKAEKWPSLIWTLNRGQPKGRSPILFARDDQLQMGVDQVVAGVEEVSGWFLPECWRGFRDNSRLASAEHRRLIRDRDDQVGPVARAAELNDLFQPVLCLVPVSLAAACTTSESSPAKSLAKTLTTTN